MDFNVSFKESHAYKVRLAAPESEFSAPFAQAMANRMSVSFHKYGYQAEADIDCVENIWVRILKYRTDGNTEWLVDAANFCMMEFMRHPDAFRATDSDESPGRVRADGSIDAEPNR